MRLNVEGRLTVTGLKSDTRKRRDSTPVRRVGDHRRDDQSRAGPGPGGEHQFGSFIREHRRPLLLALALAVAIIFVFTVLPQLAGFGKTLHRLRDGDKAWLAAGVGLECVSLFGYMALLRVVFSGDGIRIGWREGYQITMAGSVATKLLGAGGAGGIALTVWALRAAGWSAASVARRMASFEFLLYSVFMSALVVFGGGVASGFLPEGGRSTLAAFVAGFGAVVILLAVGFGFAADGAKRRLSGLARRANRRTRLLLEKLATVPETLDGGVRTTLELFRRPRLGLLGAIVYWAFDIATLWAAFRAFGSSPPIPVLILGYYIGQLANVLPLPGGIGGVEGGMIGSFIAFGVNGSTAALAVLAYRAISFWLPVVPGGVAYLRLRSSVAQWREQDALEGAGSG